jgi:hypothetical protein
MPGVCPGGQRYRPSGDQQVIGAWGSGYRGAPELSLRIDGTILAYIRNYPCVSTVGRRGQRYRPPGDQQVIGAWGPGYRGAPCSAWRRPRPSLSRASPPRSSASVISSAHRDSFGFLFTWSTKQTHCVKYKARILARWTSSALPRRAQVVPLKARVHVGHSRR